MNKCEDIMVSVVCLAYNHGKFIKKTLDGFIRQETTFPFEVFVHDDASTDDTAAIIHEYEQKYPDIIKPIYQKENQYKLQIPIIPTHILPKASGKYVAWCEGDDYWSDALKLQKQVDILEKNKNCWACIHRVEKISYFGEPKGSFFPKESLQEGVLSGEEYMAYTLKSDFPWQLSGLMIRYQDYVQYCYNPPEYKKYFQVGDIPLFLYLGTKDNVFYLEQAMSCYRTGNPNSWIGRHHSDRVFQTEYFCSKIIAYKAFDEYTKYKFHDDIENLIRKIKFKILINEHDIRQMKTSPMKDLYYSMPFTKRCKIRIDKWFPFIQKWYRKTTTIIKNSNFPH